MIRTFTFNTEIVRGDEAIEVEVSYSCTEFINATYWQPAEGGECEVSSVTMMDGQPFITTEGEDDALTTLCQDRAEADWDDYANTDWEE